jgi:hypothetical protein
MRAIIVCVVIASTSVGHAQPGLTPEEVRPEKSVATALAWSLGVTAVGVAASVDAVVAKDPGQQSAMFAFGAVGLLVGPSIGRIYAHHTWSGGLVARLVGFTGVVLGESIASACLGGPRGACPATPIKTSPFIDAMAGVVVLGALFDLATTPEAVDDYNHEHASVVVAPIRTPANATVPGLALVGRF